MFLLEEVFTYHNSSRLLNLKGEHFPPGSQKMQPSHPVHTSKKETHVIHVSLYTALPLMFLGQLRESGPCHGEGDP